MVRLSWDQTIHWSWAFLAFCLGVMLMALLDLAASRERPGQAGDNQGAIQINRRDEDAQTIRGTEMLAGFASLAANARKGSPQETLPSLWEE